MIVWTILGFLVFLTSPRHASKIAFASVGRRFVSRSQELLAEIAQLVEHATENCGVVSSILTLGTDDPKLVGDDRKAGRDDQRDGRGLKDWPVTRAWFSW